MIEGKYFFYDELEYYRDAWNYCTITDRQFYTEIKKGLRPDGLTLITNDINGVKDIPEGTYDVGDGYYDPVKRAIFDYNGNILRELEEEPEETEKWIKDKWRYNPNVLEDQYHLNGANDKIIQINQNPEVKQKFIEKMTQDYDSD